MHFISIISLATVDAAETVASNFDPDFLYLVLSVILYFGGFMIFVNIFKYIMNSAYDNVQSASSSLAGIILGTSMSGIAALARTFLNSANTEVGEYESEPTDTVQTIASTVEQTAEVSEFSVLQIILVIFAIIAMISFIVYYILKCKNASAENFWEIEQSDIYHDIDSLYKESAENAEPDASNQNMYKLSNLMSHSSGEMQNKLQHIYSSVKFLDEHDVDTRKLHSYYIPELLSIFEQSKEIEETTQFGSVLEEKQIHAKELQMKAVQTVTGIVNDLLSGCMDEKISRLQCDTEVMETVSKQDGYKQDFGFQTYS